MPGLRTKSLLKRDKPREEAEMDITPMIDCTFLLLIFFLVTSKMKSDVPIELPKARHGGVVVEEQAIILSVMKDGEQVQVFKGNSLDPADQLEGATPVEQEEAVAAYVEAESAKSSKRAVLIKAPKGIKQRDVARIEAAAGRADVDQLYVGVVEVK
jgi:biopolymer transport protein ExbD